MAVLKWLHISDIHKKGKEKVLENYDFQVVFNALKKDIKDRNEIDKQLEKLDFCFITGDISNTSKELYEAFDDLIEPLCKLTGLNLEDIFIVPGNHDIDRGFVNSETHKISKRLKTGSEINKLLIDPNVKSDRDLVFKRQENYLNFVRDKFKHIEIDENCTFSKLVKTKTNISVKIVGLNSSWLAIGGVGDRKKLALGEAISIKHYEESDAEYIISLVHHPLKQNTDWYKESEHPIITQIVNKTDFILSGHVHKPDTTIYSNPSGDFIELVSGSIFDGRKWTSNSYNFVVFDTELKKGKSYIRKYFDETVRGPRFLADLQNTINGAAGLDLKKKVVVNSIELIIRKFLEEQLRQLLNRPLLIDLKNTQTTASFDYIFPDIFVDPMVIMDKHPSSNPIKMTEWFTKYYKEGSKVLIIGEAGCGKTTILIKLLQLFMKKNYDGETDSIPFFCESRGLHWHKRVSIEDIKEYVRLKLNATHEEYNTIFKNNINSTILIDAIDESFPNIYESSKINTQNLIINFPHIATSRYDFYERSLKNESFISNYDEILVIQPWKIEHEVKEFLNKYLLKFKNDISETDEIIALLYPSLPYIPLTITAFLFIWIHHKEAITENSPKSVALLLESFLEAWATREIKQNQNEIISKEKLILFYEEVAWEMLNDLNRKVLFNLVANRISRKHQVNQKDLIANRAFLSIFNTATSFSNKGQLEITSFAHEMIYEYLIARKLVNILKSRRISNDPILGRMLGHSINKLSRELLESHTLSEKHDIVIDLSRNFYRLQPKGLNRLLEKIGCGKLDNDAIIARHNICYYWGRIEAQATGEKIKILFNQLYEKKIRDHVLVISTVGSCMFFLEAPEEEKKYLSMISDGGIHDICNRAYHLVYYGDKRYDKLDSFTKEPHGDWFKTRNAILKRLSSTDDRSQKIRSLDIVTFKRFFEASKKEPLLNSEIEIISKCTDKINLSSERNEILRNEHNKLMNLIN